MAIMAAATDSMESFLCPMIREAMTKLAIHEIDEWLMIKGQQVNPPHLKAEANISIFHGDGVFQVNQTLHTTKAYGPFRTGQRGLSYADLLATQLPPDRLVC
jgi:hypothetical protein